MHTDLKFHGLVFSSHICYECINNSKCKMLQNLFVLFVTERKLILFRFVCYGFLRFCGTARRKFHFIIEFSLFLFSLFIMRSSPLFSFSNQERVLLRPKSTWTRSSPPCPALRCVVIYQAETIPVCWSRLGANQGRLYRWWPLTPRNCPRVLHAITTHELRF